MARNCWGGPRSGLGAGTPAPLSGPSWRWGDGGCTDTYSTLQSRVREHRWGRGGSQLSVESGCCYSLQDIPSAPGARDGVLSSASPPPRPLSSLEAGVSLRILLTKHIMRSPEGAAPSSPGKSSHKVHSGWGACPNLARGLRQASLSQSDCQKQKAQPKK